MDYDNAKQDPPSNRADVYQQGNKSGIVSQVTSRETEFSNIENRMKFTLEKLMSLRKRFAGKVYEIHSAPMSDSCGNDAKKDQPVGFTGRMKEYLNEITDIIVDLEQTANHFETII